MDKKVKLTYIFLLKHNITISRWREELIEVLGGCEIPNYRIIDVIGAQLDSGNHGLDITDIIDFMRPYEYKWSILDAR